MGTGTPLHEHMTDLVLGNAWLHSYCNLYVLFLRLIVQSLSLHEVYGHVLFQLHHFISFWISPDIFVCAHSTDLFSHPFFRSDDVKWLRLCHSHPGRLCCSACAVHDEWWLNSSNDLFLLWENAQWLFLTCFFLCVLCGGVAACGFFCYLNQALRYTKAFPPLSRESSIKAFEGVDLVKRFLEGLECYGNWISLHVCLLWSTSSAYESWVETFPSMWHFNRFQLAVVK